MGSLNVLADHALQRGRDASGLLTFNNGQYSVERADYPLDRLRRRIPTRDASLVMGHSRLVTNGFGDNQPVVREGVVVFHNGIVVNAAELWAELGESPSLEIDSEIIAALIAKGLRTGHDADQVAAGVLERCRGVVAAAVAIPAIGKLLLLSNNGSLYMGETASGYAFSSEEHPLKLIEASKIEQVRSCRSFDIPDSLEPVSIRELKRTRGDLVPRLGSNASEAALLKYEPYEGRRCSRCILPDTMPFIQFDDDGVCNYCLHYKTRNQPRPVEELLALVEPYRRATGQECLLPFSGGRDSCFALHLVVEVLKLRPIAYTYDWGMVTDLGRRNISRMCAQLGVENIIVAADIEKKRRAIAKNLTAWLKAPDLGMVSILTAGDKHFFRHIETVKEQTGVSLNLWGVNPLEVTHFKAGFLGVAPDFAEERVYYSGLRKQANYHARRFSAMMRSPGYFNTSLWDTLSGEYYRSIMKKSDYFHLFDYWRWDEEEIDGVLNGYDWERAPDTSTTWRIGDGTAAFYNYVYQRVVGFTEHDTFRSNQIREGQMTRDKALELVTDENQPRYPNIKWYLDAVGLDFTSVISTVNRIPFGFTPSLPPAEGARIHRSIPRGN